VRARAFRSSSARFVAGMCSVTVAFVAAALSVALASPVLAADAPLSAQQQQGQKLYRSTCFYCHSEKVWGTLAIERRRGATDALLEKRTDLVPAFVKSVVRNGLGSMPPYRRTELTDTDADAIIAYLTRANATK
jgi:mono/diheme cytochrome c family protein